MRRYLFKIIFIFAIGFVLGTLACQSDVLASQKPVVIQVGYENNPGEPFDLAIREWARLLDEKSGGTMKLEVFPSSQLGSKNDLIDQMLAGMAVVTLADGAFYADRGVPDFGILFGPFLFESWDEVWKLTKSDWYHSQCALLEKQGLKIIASNWIYGDRHLLTKKAVHSVSDLKGMKIRVPNNIIQIKGFEVLGAAPTPMPLGEVYTALQQGVIDGVENPLPVLYGGKFHEVAKNLSLTAHVRNFTTLVTGTALYNSLTPTQQRWLTETCEEAGLYNNNLQQKAVDETLKKFAAEGVKIINVNRAEFAKASLPFYSLPEFTSKWSKGLYETVKKAMK
ncbi:MAG TPA: C4-dicarboxylate TRAP transporter substrate-binding protein [Acetomicrobium flavidum]|uniref:C4-dicarboxylate TRAP transporter substrate-binding protein n=1 Tax=Acetomicrobium flavidum TaxID=49896 RepID=UPI002C0CFC1D|nr:C4-dicarboxylate TRAP transporter substrate-binding protein [Acetomicrobium flavidum]